MSQGVYMQSISMELAKITQHNKLKTQIFLLDATLKCSATFWRIQYLDIKRRKIYLKKSDSS